MSQLTGLLTGSPQSDLFTGSLEVVDLTADTTEAGIGSATINALSGDDAIEGIVTLAPGAGDLTLNATGILETTIDAGPGSDTILGRGSASRFLEGFGSRGPRFSGIGTGVGLADSTVMSGGGNDVLTFIGEGDGFPFMLIDGVSARFANSTGIVDSTVDAGPNNDTITIEGTVGALRSTVLGGGQQDTITVEAEGESGFTVAAEDSTIKGNGGADTLTLSATARGEVSALRSTRVKGGADDDIISVIGTATGTLNGSQLAPSDGVAVEANTVISGGAGNDAITIRGITSASGGASAVGLSGSEAYGGSGNDTITIGAEATGLSAISRAAIDATIGGGSGNDVIQFEAIGGGSSATVVALSDSKVRGGLGDDVLSFKVGGGSSDATRSTGIFNSTVQGNGGNDLFIVEIEPFDFANDDEQPEYDIVDALIFGGTGDDTFDVGIGDGTLKGGAGNDLAVIDYFDAETMDVSAIANGIQIVGSQTRNGTEGSWTQNIKNTESFQIGDDVFTADSLLSTFAV